MSHSPTVLVTGASSQLGVFLLPRLAAEGMDVTALSRFLCHARARQKKMMATC